MLNAIAHFHSLSLCLLLAVAALDSVHAHADTAQIPMHAVKSGVFYIKGNLDGLVDTDMLVDTGSGYVSLSKRTFDLIRDDATTVFQRHITGVMANGRMESVAVYRIGELKLTGECILRDIEVAVFNNASRDILGLNALRQIQPITLQLDPPLMTATCS